MVLVKPCFPRVEIWMLNGVVCGGGVPVSRTCTYSAFVQASYTGGNPAHIA